VSNDDVLTRLAESLADPYRICRELGVDGMATVRVADCFLIGLPYARAINPITKTNWGGTGVEPDVKSRPRRHCPSRCNCGED